MSEDYYLIPPKWEISSQKEKCALLYKNLQAGNEIIDYEVLVEKFSKWFSTKKYINFKHTFFFDS